ncbi:O-antigen polymerase [Romboutsia sp. 1001713B170131_170501_G6]|uniref:O-antigen polymerase n=1 Tax=Romboutsia sp. 1001713B170131_170501_G6 TaxID=2787108 RepID=UPI0018ABA596|nr:O-antigen polymerase [Romboutsia sp. 1001713B170131_170501_G6]
MYILLYIVVFMNVLLLTKMKYNTILKPNILFSLMWCICGSISTLGLYGMYNTSHTVNFYALTAIITFNFVYILSNDCIKSSKIKVAKGIIGEVRLVYIYLLNIISWIFISRILVNSLKIISTGGFKLLRIYAFEGLATTIELTISQWLVTPIFEATVILAIVYTITKKKAKYLKIIAIIDILLNIITFGGRYFIVKSLIYYIIAFIVIKFKNINGLSRIKINKKVIIISISLIAFLTSMRSWNGTSIIKETVLYFTSSFSFLDSLLKENLINDKFNIIPGTGILGFIYNIILVPITLLLGIPYRGSDYNLTQITSIPRNIGGGINYNALATMIYPLLLDFGYIGIIIGTAFLAILASFIERMLDRSNKLIYLCMYIFVGNIIFSSVMNYYLIFPATGFTIIMLIILTKNNKNRIEEINKNE